MYLSNKLIALSFSSIWLLLITGCTGTQQEVSRPSVSAKPVASEATAAELQAVDASEYLSAQILSVGDGDTVRVQQADRTITVRLACIDAPEIAQSPWGQQSASRLKQLLPVEQTVQIREVDTDRYGRTVAELYKDGQSVNLQMVQKGEATVYRQYLDGCTDTKKQYLQAEAKAQENSQGFWSQPSPCMPWDYRRGQCETAQVPTAIPQSASDKSLPSCTSTDCNCSDFSTQAEAQEVFNAFADDRFRLDGDGNGIACESLP